MNRAGGTGGASRGPFPRPVLWTLGGIGIVQLLVASGRLSNADAASMLELSRALVRGSIHIPDTVSHVIGADGMPVCHFGILTSIWWMPFVLMGRLFHAILPAIPLGQWEEFWVSFSPIPVTLALLGYVAAFWHAGGLDARRIRVGLLVLAFATPLWPYAKLLGSDLPMALTIVAATYHASRDRGTGGWVVAGLWLGAAILARKQAQIVVPWVALCLAILAGTRGAAQTGCGLVPRLAGWSFAPARVRLMALAAGLVPGVLAQLAYNWLRYRNPVVERYAGSAPGDIAFVPAEFFERLFSLLFGGARGLLIYDVVPIVLVVLAWRRWGSRLPVVAWVWLGLAASNLAFFGVYAYWAGGVAFGPRLLLFLTPLLGLAWADAIAGATACHRRVIAVSVVVGFLIHFPATLVDPLAAHRRAGRDPALHGNFIAAYWAEAARVMGSSFGALPRELEGDDVLKHAPFRRPDFWWVHAAAEIRQRRVAAP